MMFILKDALSEEMLRYPEGLSDPQIADQKGYSNEVLPLLFDIAAEFGIFIAIHVEPYAGRSGATVRRDPIGHSSNSLIYHLPISFEFTAVAV